MYRSADIADTDGKIASGFVAKGVAKGEALLMLRPELLRVLSSEEKAEGVIGAEVTEMFGKGGTVQYRARTPSGQSLVIEIPGTSSLPMRIGDTVRLGFAKKDIYVFRREPDHGR
jgi:ABC-type Fe3+/spermidine/putrescine transport system ATPase subunit